MGSVLGSHADLVHVRGWTMNQISVVFDTLRVQGAKLVLHKDSFTRYIGGRHNEAVSIFNDLDTDFDGKVDVFEVLTMLTLWSGTTWEEKEELLFRLFDLVGKGSVKSQELQLMVTVLIQTLKKFVKLPPELGSLEAVRMEDAASFPSRDMDLTQFRDWAQSHKRMKELRQFLEDHAARAKATMKASQMQLRCTLAEKFTQRLFLRITQLQESLPVFADTCADHVNTWGRRKRWDFTMQNVREIILSLQQAAEQMQQSVFDLHKSLKEADETSDLTSLIDPRTRFWQEQILNELETNKVKAAKEFRELTHHMWHLIELTEQGDEQSKALDAVADADAGSEDLPHDLVDTMPAKVSEQRSYMREVHQRLVDDVSEGGPLFVRSLGGMQLGDAPPPAGSAPVLAGSDASAAPQDASSASLRERVSDLGRRALNGGVDPDRGVLIAVADFEPPPSHESQILKLAVGEVVTVLGQDGRGWWFGRKDNGAEGWFPPSYVQVKPAHHLQAAAAAPAPPVVAK